MPLKRNLCIVLSTIIILTVAGSLNAQDSYTVSGVVSGPGATPIAGVKIEMYTEAGDPIGQYIDTTDATGFYSISSVFSDDYGIRFKHITDGFAPQSTAITVEGSNLTFNMTLEIGYILSGYVRNSVGDPLQSIDLNIYDQSTGDKLYSPSDNTDPTGFYDVVLPAGTFRIRYREVLGRPYVPIELKNITIAGVTSLDVVLENGFRISGKVLGPGAIPVVGADLDAVISATGFKIYTPNDNTDAQGEYEIMVPAGILNIDVAPPSGSNLLPGLVSNITITNNLTLDFTLVSGFILSGTVTDGLGRAGVPDVDIDVDDASTGLRVYTPNDLTDEFGQYEIVLPAGTYNVFYEPPVVPPYLALSVTNGLVMSGNIINDVIVPDGVLLSGTVQNTSAAGIFDTDIDVKVPLTGVNLPLTGDHTDVDGTFAIVIVPGTYDIEIEPPLSTHLVPKLLASYSVNVDMDILVTHEAGYSVSGTVTDISGIEVPDVNIDVIISASTDTIFTPNNNTDLNGFYEIIIPSGTYDLIYKSIIPADTVSRTNISVIGNMIYDVILTDEASDLCGDSNNDGGINILDVVYIINYKYKAGPAPEFPTLSDVNSDSSINILDVVYLINFKYKAGPSPNCP